MNDIAEYRHTQKSPLWWLLAALAIGMLCIAWGLRHDPNAMMMLIICAALIVVVAGSIHHLTVTGEDFGLWIRFGPIPNPFLRRFLPYSTIESVEASNSSVIDGWGVHYIPGRGWTYNIWGFRCVLIRRDNKSQIRVGTDDVEGLLAFLQSRLDGSGSDADHGTEFIPE